MRPEKGLTRNDEHCRLLLATALFVALVSAQPVSGATMSSAGGRRPRATPVQMRHELPWRLVLLRATSEAAHAIALDPGTKRNTRPSITTGPCGIRGFRAPSRDPRKSTPCGRFKTSGSSTLEPLGLLPARSRLSRRAGTDSSTRPVLACLPALTFFFRIAGPPASIAPRKSSRSPESGASRSSSLNFHSQPRRTSAGQKTCDATVRRTPTRKPAGRSLMRRFTFTSYFFWS